MTSVLKNYKGSKYENTNKSALDMEFYDLVARKKQELIDSGFS